MISRYPIPYFLKEIRSEYNLSYSFMASHFNISTSYYYQIENGHRNLSYYLAFKISSFFNLKPDELFYDDFHNFYKHVHKVNFYSKE